jgi:5'(3')-deoxyribonucleotidase
MAVSPVSPGGDVSFVLGVDLDGVCGDHTAAFRQVVAELREVDVETLPLERGWDFVEWAVDEIGGFDHVHRIAVLEHRMFRSMPVMPGAAEALWRLSDAGVWIRVITHRLCVNWGHAVAVADTVAWLDSTGVPYRDICFLGEKTAVGADCYVEDSPANIEALRAGGNHVIVFDAPYNRDVPGPRADTWSEVETMVLELAADRGFVLQGQLPGLDDPTDRLRTRTQTDSRK